VLLGRETELARLRALLAGARDGQSFGLVLHGEAGIGKTALLLAVAEEAARDDFSVLPVRGEEGGAELPWAGLQAIATPLHDLVERLPDVQRRALRAALSLEPSTGPDRFTVPVALLGLLSAAAESAPVLVLADDVQWLDPATRDALLFVARRLGNEGVGLLLAARDDEGWDPAATRMERIHLAGLAAADARTLVGEQVAPGVLEALHAQTAGNPLALTELPASLTDAERAGREPLPNPLPAGERVEELFARQIAVLPETVRRTVGVAAAMVGRRADILARALTVLGLARDDLTAAERDGVLTIEGAALTFRHPLVRAAAYHGMPEDERRAVHRVLAEVAPDERVRAWHLARAAVGPDEEAAAALERAALDARERGAPGEASHTWQRAAALSPDPAQTARRRVEAATDALDAADTARALDDLAELERDETLDPALRSEVRRLAGVAMTRHGRLWEGIELLEREAAALEAAEPVMAAMTLLLTAGGHLGAGDMARTAAAARRARELAGDVPAIGAAADVVEGEALVPQGYTLQGSALIEAGANLLDPAGDDAVEVVTMVAHSRIWIERYEPAFDLLDDLVREAREAGAIARLVYPLGVRAELERRRGRWPSALADATEAVRLGRDAGMGGTLAHALATAARIEGPLGRVDDARRHGLEALELTAPHGYGALVMHALGALGVTELGAGDVPAALTYLREAAERYDAMGWGEPSLVQFGGDLVEALVAAGEREEAERTLERLAADAARTRGAWAQAVAGRGRGLLAADEGFEAHFERALASHERTPQPFERARTELLLGERRRRAGRRAEGREPLRRALEAFEQLGARPWADRARRELAGAGGVAEQPKAAPKTAELTGQEWRIALLVAQGLTNREAGAALFLSPKTIEHHLSGIYKKLGVRSRTQLAMVVADEDRPVVVAGEAAA
jgi:DNA-binding CsgD family transcriptional regulator